MTLAQWTLDAGLRLQGAGGMRRLGFETVRAVRKVLNVASGVSTPVSRLAEVIAETLGTSPSVLSTEGGDSQEFSTAKVRGLLPEYPRFEPDYPVNILGRRVPEIARALMDGAIR
jgi:hypothetical protein